MYHYCHILYEYIPSNIASFPSHANKREGMIFLFVYLVLYIIYKYRFTGTSTRQVQ